MSKGEITRQRIIEHAAPLFNQRGFAGCSMQDIMDATGLEKGALYRHFHSKEELAAEAFRYALNTSVKTRTDHIDPSLGAVATLRAIVDQFIRVPSAISGGCALMNTAIDADDGNPALRSLALEAVQEWKHRICAVVEKGKCSGEVRAETRPSWLADTIIATLEGALMISRLEGSKTALQHAQTSLELVIGSVESR